jgi:hypothetical protein
MGRCQRKHRPRHSNFGQSWPEYWQQHHISGAFPPEYNVTRTITKINDNSYQFGLELDYEPGNLAPAIATPKALTARAKALANTTRPMSELDATANAICPGYRQHLRRTDERLCGQRTALSDRTVLRLGQHVLQAVVSQPAPRIHHVRTTDDQYHNGSRAVDRDS